MPKKGRFREAFPYEREEDFAHWAWMRRVVAPERSGEERLRELERLEADAPARDDHAAVARDVSIDDDATAVTDLEVGTVFGVFRGQHGEHLFPVVFFGRAVEGGEDKHQDLHAHAYREHDIAAREVQYLEEGTPNDDGGAYTVCKVEKSFSRVTREEFFDAVFISLVFSHNG